MTKAELTIIENNIKAQLQGKKVASIFLSDAPGTAKSSTLMQLANDLDYNYMAISSPSLAVESMTGLPSDERAPYLDSFTIVDAKAKRTDWSAPEVVAQINKLAEDKPVMFVIEDFHMIPGHLQPYFYTILLERTLGNFKFASNIAIVGTMNNSEEAGLRSIPSPIRNRMAILKLKFNFDYWYESWAKENLDYRVSSFLKNNPDQIQEDETTGIEGFASARAWTAISEELSIYEDQEFVTQQAGAIASMQISSAASIKFSSHVKYIAALDFKHTVKNRNLINLDTKEPLDAMLYPYIVNFIHTAKDGLYLLELLQTNMQYRTFIGLTIGEIYSRYRSKTTHTTEGMKLVIELLTDGAITKANHAKITDKDLSKISKSTSAELLEIAQAYIL